MASIVTRACRGFKPDGRRPAKWNPNIFFILGLRAGAILSVMYATFSTTTTNLADDASRSLATRPDVGDLLDLFCQALEEVNRLERRPVCSSVEYVMRQWRASLDLSAAGFSDIESLAAEAERRGLIRLAHVGGDLLAQRKATSSTTALPCYRSFFERKLKCPLPPPHVRQRIYDLAVEHLTENVADASPVSLLDLSYQVSARLAGTAGQHSVFKLLFSLVLANALTVARSNRPHDIRVSTPVVPANCWDELFVITCLAGLRKDRPSWPLDTEKIAEVFGVPESMIQHLVSMPRPRMTAIA
jgi:hypothetical protein